MQGHSISDGNHIQVATDIMVPMRDGIALATDIYRPASAENALPILLERTPYNKSGTNLRDFTLADPVPASRPELAARFAQHGYIVVLQDCRGRYKSEGIFTKYLNEAEDGFDTLAWLLQQDWCNGKVGTFGLSYGAHTQMALACLAPPGLAAMFLESGGFSSAFHSGIRQGGAFELKQATWAHLQAQQGFKAAGDDAGLAALQSEDLRDWFGRMPWSPGNSPLRAAPEYEDYLFAQWRNGTFGSYWKSPGIYARGYYDEIADVPMVHMTGWFDPYARTATENFVGLSGIKSAPVKLVMGPWTHGQRSTCYAGDVDFGTAATLDNNIAPDYVALRAAWFDHHLKGRSAPNYLPSPVKIFVMGGGTGRRNAHGRLDHGGAWRDEDSWPLARAREVSFYLQSDGSLAPTASQRSDEARSFDFDPRHPVPTIGGAVTSGEPLMRAGAFDQRETAETFGARAPFRPLAERADVLVFESNPLPSDVEVTGPIAAVLYVSSSAPDTDFTIKLMDVYPTSSDWPEGFAMNLTHGILRMRYRDSFTEPKLMEQHKIYEIKIEAFPTANLFAKGHRIRVDVSSSNFPHFDVNPNSGEPEGEAFHMQVARNTVHMDGARPSRILLPIVPAV